jgi:hypothetical protein
VWPPQLHVICCRLSPPIPPPDGRPVLDAADVAAAAEGGSTAATIDSHHPPHQPSRSHRPPCHPPYHPPYHPSCRPLSRPLHDPGRALGACQTMGQVMWRLLGTRACLFLRRPGGVESRPFGGISSTCSFLTRPPYQPLSHPNVTPHLPTSVPLCSPDAVSGRVSSPHPGTPPPLLLSGGESTGGCSTPTGEVAQPTPSALVQRAG